MISNFRVFTTSEELLSVKQPWNELVYRQCENPYFLSSFIEQFFQSRLKEGITPFFLVYYIGQRIVGLAPFTVRSWKRLFRVANFLIGSEFDPDFVVQEECREDFLYKSVYFLLKKVNCNIIDISLPSETKSLQALKKISKTLGAYHLIRSTTGHSVLPVEGSWTEFEKERGRNFRRFFRKIERKMESAGKWKVVIPTEKNYQIEIFNDILRIEKSSWKHEYWARRGRETDFTLPDLWTGASKSSLETGFKWQVVFLEINGKKIAYSFWLEYKDKGIICKTSFDNDYRKYYPGIYVNNLVVRELFNNPTIKKIDFMTDLPFHVRWMPKLLPRFRITISKSWFPMLFARTLNNQNFLSMRRIIRQAVFSNEAFPFL